MTPSSVLVPSATPHLDTAVDGVGIAVNDIEITASCVSDGVNVTVKLNGKSYSGAIYASERYRFCRQTVVDASQFSLFLPRPTISTTCNTLEVVRLDGTGVSVSSERSNDTWFNSVFFRTTFSRR